MTGTNHWNRRSPFLHRNWLKAMDRLQEMDVNARHLDHDEDDHRPVKRRRILENSPDSGIGLDNLDGISLASEGGQPEKALRIEVLKIIHKDSARVKANLFTGPLPPHVKDLVDAKARCRIFIGYDRDGFFHPLHIDSQICSVKTYKNPAGPSRMVRIILPQPFHVLQDKILVPREDDDGMCLAEAYTAHIQLESAGDPNWPPDFLNAVEGDARLYGNRPHLPPRQWLLNATINNLFQCHRKNVELRLGRRETDQLPTDYVVDVDVRWTSGLSAKGMKRLEKDVRPSITCFGDGGPMDLDSPPAVNGVNGVNCHLNGVHGNHAINGYHEGGDGDLVNGSVNGDHLDDMDDQPEGEVTPGRRRRARPQINYNLKHLSDQAQRKERRKRQKLRDKNSADAGDDHGVTYLFPEHFHLDDFACCLCAAPHHSFEQLRIHYHLAHEEYDFAYDIHAKVVSVARKPHPLRTPSAPKVYQLGPPQSPFDFAAYLKGDDSWITSRLGSENDKETGPRRTVAVRENYTFEQLVPKPRQTKITVPRTKTTLYHPLSKAPLQPGTKIDRYVADESWLIQKHSECLGDYSDLEPAEKEFLKMWDSFILPLHISSEKYLPRAFMAFVKEKASWIVAKQARSVQFSKHMQALYVRGSIDERVMKKALDYLDQARASGPDEEPVESPKRSKNGCARCGKFVPNGPAWLACTAPDCKTPLFHTYCVTDPICPTDDRDYWKCDACCS